MSTAALLRSGLFWTGAASFMLIGVVLAFYGPALPALARAHGIGLAEAGAMISLHALGALAALVWTTLRGGASGRLAMGFLAAGAAAAALAPVWAAALAGAAAMGFGYGLTTVVFNRRFLTETGPHGPGMVGFLNATFAIGAIAGPLGFVAMGGAPGPAFGAVALAAAVLLPFAGGTGAPGPAAGGTGAALRALARRPGLFAVGALAVGTETALVGLGPSALAARGLTEVAAAQLLSGFFLAFLLVRTGLLWLAARMRAGLILALGLGLTGALLLAAAMLPPGPFFALSGAAVGVMFPAYFVAAAQALGSDERTAAMVIIPCQIGAVAGPALVAAVLAATGAAALFKVLAAVALAGALAALAALARA
jgi:hypothetical protein